MLLPRDTLRFIAYPLLFEAFQSYSSAIVAYLSLRFESCCHALPLLRQAVRGRATPLLFDAGLGYALAFIRALRR